MAETVGESTRATFSTASGRPGWPPRSVEVSTTSRSYAPHCLSRRLGDDSDACGRPRVQELSSEASWHLVFTRRASTPWLELLREQGLTVERDAVAGGSLHVWDGCRRAL